MRMPHVIWMLLIGLFAAGSLRAVRANEIDVSSQRRINFDRDWRFYKGEAPGAESPDFDDSQWRIIRLPHDWAIEGPFDQNAIRKPELCPSPEPAGTARRFHCRKRLASDISPSSSTELWPTVWCG